MHELCYYECYECHMHVDNTWQRKRYLGKRTASQFEQILSEICSAWRRRSLMKNFELHALYFSGKGISMATLLGIFLIRIPSFDDLCWGEEDFCSSCFILSGIETLMEKIVEVLSVFIVQRKISLLFQNFEVKIHLKLFLFLVSKVTFTRKSVILQNRIK